MRRLSPRDPIGAHRRKVVAARRVGVGSFCACGESRPEALLVGTNPTTCAACQRKGEGRSTADKHHFAGAANSTRTIVIPVNDHQAELNVAQADWPTRTLRNPDRSP